MDRLDLSAEILIYDKETNNCPPVKREIDFLELENLDEQPQNGLSFNSFPNPIQQVNEQLTNQLPIDLSPLTNMCKIESIAKDDAPYFVKYKLQDDGKHVKIWECRTCCKEFGHQYTLMRHLPTHTDERKFQCNICGKAFRQMSTLSQHRAIHSHERPYICEICQKNFNRVSTLISHRKTHTGIKPHQCHLCNKAFHQKGNLRNHIFTHTNERPYKCEDCGKGFNQMSNLMCHKLKSHQRVEKPKHCCQICKKTFTKRMALRNHEQYEHRTNVSVLDSLLIEEPNRIANAIMVEPINTKAMQVALETDQIPFALLRPLTGIPVLVRVLPAGNDKQMLVPASADDLKKHGQISVTPKTNPNTSGQASDGNLVGSTVQIKIPVVATVVQQSNERGHLSMCVVSPGPRDHQTIGQKDSDPNDVNTFIFNANSDENVQSLNVDTEELNYVSDMTHQLSDAQLLGDVDNVLKESNVDDIMQQDVFIIQ